MHGIPLLDELAIIAGVGVIVALVLARLRLPTVAGLLLAGALLGPHAFGLVKSVDAIHVLSEIGVVLLLFTIGLEFSLARLKNIFKQVALGGFLQVGLTVLVTMAVAMALGEPANKAIFYGFIVALSSTAIVLRALGERRELDAPHGRFIVGTLIFQDLMVVPMVLAVPLLAKGGSASSAALDIGIALGKAALVVVIVLAVARLVVPRVLALVDASKSRDIFLLAVLALCIGTAWLTSLTGLSLALGAFLGGMVVADTEYGHRAMGDLLPLRDVFVSIFFVSLGMLFEPAAVLAHPVMVALVTVGFIVGKGFLATLAAMVMRFPRRVAWLAGVGLAQFGEFGFVLTTLAVSEGLIKDTEVAPVLAAGILSMFLTPLVIRAAPHLSAGERLLAPLERLFGVKSIDDADTGPRAEHTNHVIIVGHGVAGRLVTTALKQASHHYLVLELDLERVREARKQGEPVYYGDATSEEALGHAHLEDAKALVLLMNDPIAAQRVVDVARRIAPRVPIYMRTRYLSDTPLLEKMGATEVIAEELEGGLTMSKRLLARLGITGREVDQHISSVRRITREVTLDQLPKPKATSPSRAPE